VLPDSASAGVAAPPPGQSAGSVWPALGWPGRSRQRA
jgi:hypothetical protein